MAARASDLPMPLVFTVGDALPLAAVRQRADLVTRSAPEGTDGSNDGGPSEASDDAASHDRDSSSRRMMEQAAAEWYAANGDAFSLGERAADPTAVLNVIA